MDPIKNFDMDTEQRQTDHAEETPGDLGGTPPEDLADYLREFTGNGSKLSLYRRSPLWCSGFLEQYPLDSPISLQDIRDSYGGRRFELRVLDMRGKMIAIRYVTIADVPRVRGVPLEEGPEYRKGGTVITRDPRQEARERTAEQALAALERANERNQELLLEVLAAKSAAQAAAAPVNPVDQIGQMLGLFEQFQKFAGAQGATGGGGSDFLPLVKLFAEEILPKMQKQRQPDRGPVAHRQTLPLPRTQAPAQPPTEERPSPAMGTTDSPPSVPREGEPHLSPVDNPDELPSLDEELAEAGPEAAAEIIAATLERWTPEQQQAAISALMKSQKIS